MSDQPEQPTSKKLEAKRARRLAEERKAAEMKKAARRRSLITILLAVGVGILVVGLIVSNRPGSPGDDTGVADIGGPETAEAAGCTPVQEHEDEGHEHIPEGTPITYKTDPPTSGNHWPPGSQAAPGFYATPVESERLVHNLEHGQIVFWYKTDAPEKVKDDLEQITLQPDQSTIAVPYDFEGPGQFAMTSWHFSQSCEETSQTVIDDFRREHQGHGREAVAPPFSG